MRGISFNIINLIILVFLLLIIILRKRKKEEVDQEGLDQFKNIFNIIPMIGMMELTLFLCLKFIFKIHKVNIYFLDTIAISICAVLIIIISAQISKKIILFIRTMIFSTKYGGRKLTDKERDDISNSKESNSKLWNSILTFIICGLLYSIMNAYIFNENEIISTLIISFVSTIFYYFIF
ncbi:hypothetical protein R0131_00730 [Clostridium sp. AL.422]|uniref:hypothetical protein n=1 Tax=Clostridium TaxID=1485 RepID=UPI00293DC9C9|nr:MULTISPECIES: hypothetical protein [unclassified Clostridium]MDV4149352.1 hypothetical protein [Clostridium sp. AL.422]